jgi:hypothetical protein
MTKQEYVNLDSHDRRKHVIEGIMGIKSKVVLQYMLLKLLSEEKTVDDMFLTYLET